MALNENSIAQIAEKARFRAQAVLSSGLSASLSRSAFVGRRTIKREISCRGIGLHNGCAVSLTLRPAEAGSGIVFHRTDVEGRGAVIPALWQNARVSQLCTTLVDEATGASIATVEHLLAAIAAMGVDDLRIDIQGAEAPAMDGSAAPFVFLIESAGLVESSVMARTAYRVTREITVEDKGASATLEPSDSFAIDFRIDFPVAAIGQQQGLYDVTPGLFKSDLMRARTFALVDDLPKLRTLGLGLGGSLDNAVVVNGAEILNEGGLRYHDEFVRHKALDAIGDLSLAGRPLLARYTGVKASHALNTRLLQALFAADAVEEVDLPSEGSLVDDLMSALPLRASA